MLDDKKILFIVQQTNEDRYNICQQAIQSLCIPDGYISETASWNAQPGINRVAIYNEIINQSNAKYKIYLDENVRIINTNIIRDILYIFKNNKDIGMLGLVGTNSMPLEGNWTTQKDSYGKYYYTDNNGIPVEHDLGGGEENYQSVKYIHNMLIATQYDVSWRLDLFKTDIFSSLSQSMEFIRRGYKVVIPRQSNAWCLYAGKTEIVCDDIDKIRFITEYAGELVTEKNSKSIGTSLYDFGKNSYIKGTYEFNNPQGVSIGNDVCIETGAYFKLSEENKQSEPKIIISNGCCIGRNCSILATNRILIENNVSIASNVYITDYLYGHKMIGVPIVQQKSNQINDGIVIGKGSRLEGNVVIQGNVHIGCGSLIMANSVVSEDVPDYAVVSGNPAKVVELFDRESGNWEIVKNDEHLRNLVQEGKKARPILTIGIPTYNRAYCLKKCLKAIYDQIGNDDLFEIFVSDNDSTDETKAVVDEYKKLYDNLRYEKNIKNIGPTKNYFKIWNEARGEYVVAVGDDDYFSDGVLYQLIYTIYKNRNAAIITMIPANTDFYSEHFEGMNSYIANVSYLSTYITGMVLRRQDFKRINQKDAEGFIDTGIGQVAVQLEVLKRNNNFAILFGKLFAQGTGENVFISAEEYEKKRTTTGFPDLGRVFIKNYLDILYYYKKYGILDECLRMEKGKLLENMIIPWCKLIMNKNVRWQSGKVKDFYKEYYSEEPYFERKYEELKRITSSDNKEDMNFY